MEETSMEKTTTVAADHAWINEADRRLHDCMVRFHTLPMEQQHNKQHEMLVHYMSVPVLSLFREEIHAGDSAKVLRRVDVVDQAVTALEDEYWAGSVIGVDRLWVKRVPDGNRTTRPRRHARFQQPPSQQHSTVVDFLPDKTHPPLPNPG